ncbi:hypothetical protein A9Q99_16025 [Gammaproteobacteria bacterium 45_16_T64]|mgnify:CR=1 FL=1|nr:hypothetical protein A9Q99_16025 [Gammaproteobacteria bacterium 45_16_T64]
MNQTHFKQGGAAILLALLLLVSTGCSWVDGVVQSQAKRMLSQDLVFAKASTFGRSLAITQQVDVSIGSRKFSMIQQTEIDATEIRLAGLSHFGSPFFTLQYIGTHLISEKMPLLPDAFHVPVVLRDFQLSFWPLTELRAIYRAKGYDIVERDKQRILLKDGGEIITVHYQYSDKMLGKADFEHHQLGYRVVFNTVDVQRLEE